MNGKFYFKIKKRDFRLVGKFSHEIYLESHNSHILMAAQNSNSQIFVFWRNNIEIADLSFKILSKENKELLKKGRNMDDTIGLSNIKCEECGYKNIYKEIRKIGKDGCKVERNTPIKRFCIPQIGDLKIDFEGYKLFQTWNTKSNIYWFGENLNNDFDGIKYNLKPLNSYVIFVSNYKEIDIDLESQVANWF